MHNTYSAGVVTAYGAAKKAGYTGTYEEFCAEQAQFAQNAQQVREDKESVEQTVETFEETTVPAAVQAVTDEGTTQVGRVNQAGATQVESIGSAGTTQVGNVNQAGSTQVSAVNQAGATQIQAVEDKGGEVIASIPQDYSELTAEVDDLKNAIQTDIKDAENGTETFYGFSDFQHYALTVNGAYNTNQKYRVSCVDIITLERDITVSVASGFRWGLFTWVNGTGTWSGWKTTPYTIAAGTAFTVQIGRTADVTSEIADVAEFLSKVTFKTSYAAAINKTAKKITNKAFIDILHMGGNYQGTIGNDRLEAIEYNCKIGGFRAMEIDVQFTSDNIPVMIHLDTNSADSHLFTDVEGNYVAVTVSENTFDQLQTYNYLGTKVAKLEDGVKVCKQYGVDVALDKVFYFDSEKLTIVENLINKMGMEDNVYFIGPSVATAQSILTWYPKAKIIFTTTPTNWINDNSWVENFANNTLASLYVMFENSSVTDNNIDSIYSKKPNYMKLGVYTVDNILTYEKRFYQFAFVMSNALKAGDLKDDVI